MGEGAGMKDKRNMIFKHDKPFHQLREKGEVVTLRKERKDSRPVWISRGYPGKGYGKVCEAYRTRGKTFSFDDGLSEFYLKKSGFSTLEEWKEAVRENGETDEIPDQLYRHEVNLNRVRIKHYYWKDWDSGGPDNRGVQTVIQPFDGELASPSVVGFDPIEVWVAGDPRYE
jgi:hypothetical protein